MIGSTDSWEVTMLTAVHVCEHGNPDNKCKTCALELRVQMLENQVRTQRKFSDERLVKEQKVFDERLVKEQKVFDERLAKARELNASLQETIVMLGEALKAYHPLKVEGGVPVGCRVCEDMSGGLYHYAPGSSDHYGPDSPLPL
jgi:adenylosuccinate synthase